jgi:5-methyltetrahydrofolate--homocysteine methyltransferase
MVHVAREMERERFTVPLLIGGATTSKTHTAVKIAPAYREPVVHVLDASRAVPVIGNLLNAARKPAFLASLQEDQARVRAQRASQAARLLPLAEARRRAPKLRHDDLPQPTFTGVRVLSSDQSAIRDPQSAVDLSELVPFIDWSPFFHTWELRGRYPAILNHEKHGEQARQLYADAQTLLAQIVRERRLIARAIYGFFPANSVGDDVELYTDASRSQVLTRFHFLRQQFVKEDGSPNWCLADFIAPKSTVPTSGHQAPTSDSLGAFAVTTGHGLKELLDQFKADHDDYRVILAEALADRLAEAFAEWLHRRVRIEWGYGKDERLTNEQIIDEQYRGIRPAPGYPACPDHTEKQTLWRLLEVEERAGIKLTETFAMWPGSSVSGFYFAHPESKYFAVGKLGRDQVEDYSRRKGMTLPEAEKWLGPYLNYEPSPPVVS